MDTSPEIAEKLAARYAAMTPAEKMQRVRDLTIAACEMSLAGLRSRHPQATERQLLRLLADRLLGHELARAVYGPAEISA